ncbi:MAG TPA: EAL domain-containing protein [Candidatus Sulfotelmatobacter sp.]|nr:EAL domain-containing protein [Candidatus Sulfotelmatobacter sp.]
MVDDSPSAVALMVRLLETVDGCETVGFTSSVKALEWCRGNAVDLVVVDYEMPPPNGIAFIEAFRADSRNAAIPVVMVTSVADRDIRYMALQTGATDFLSKPIDQVEFVARMRNLLASCRAHKRLAELSVWLTDEVRKASLVITQSPGPVIITNRDGIIEYVNPAFTEATGYGAEELAGRTPNILKSGLTPPDVYVELWSTITSGHVWRGTFQNRRKDGSLFWETARISPLRNEAGEITHFVAVKEDITLRKEYEARLEWQANYDSLTGLPNRMLVLDRLGQAVAVAGRNRCQVTVMHIDLDRFRAINDTLGHGAGDDVLRQVAHRLLAEQHQTDTVARVGNDEFVMVLSDIGEAHSPQAVASRLCAVLAQPFQIQDQEVFISARIGIAVFPTDGETPQELLRSATAAMPGVDSAGHGGWRFFTHELDANARRRLAVESNLRHALGRGELRIYYQPLVEVASGRILAAEALLRWNNPDLGPVPPDLFIPIAEETGLIVAIGAWVIEMACRDMAAWAENGLPPVRVAINVSSLQLAGNALLDVVDQALSYSGLSADRLELEVTERLLLDQSPHTIELLHKLRGMGLRFSIDDFGTGYSSMSYLTSFPFDVLKIDRSFISRVTERDQDKALTQAIIAMGHSLDLEIVAEGVETQEQLQFLSDNGCDFAQGYLFTKPIPAEAFAELLKRHDCFRP